MRDKLQGAGRSARSAFTLVELLVVMGIIVILAGMVVGVGVALRARAARDSAYMLVKRIETALEQYWDEFGMYPEAIETSPTVAANITVARVLLQADAVASHGQGGGRSEIVYESPDKPHVVDYWGNEINIADEGLNRPGLDIWSSGPNGANERNTADPNDYGDDIVNWGRR